MRPDGRGEQDEADSHPGNSVSVVPERGIVTNQERDTYDDDDETDCDLERGTSQLNKVTRRRSHHRRTTYDGITATIMPSAPSTPEKVGAGSR
jgi:hypothetical protein